MDKKENLVGNTDSGSEMTEDSEIKASVKVSADKYQQEFKKLIEIDPAVKDRWLDALINLNRTEIDDILDYFYRQAKQGQEQELVLGDFLGTYRNRFKKALEEKVGQGSEDDHLVDAWLDFHEKTIRQGVELKIRAGMSQKDAIAAEISSLKKKSDKDRGKTKEEDPINDPILAEFAPPKVEPPTVNPVKRFINDAITGFNNWINKVGGKKNKD